MKFDDDFINKKVLNQNEQYHYKLIDRYTTFSKIKKRIRCYKKSQLKSLNINNSLYLQMSEFWILASSKQKFLKSITLFTKTGDFIFLNNFISLYSIISSRKTNHYNISKTNYNTQKFKSNLFQFFNTIKNYNSLTHFSLQSTLFLNFNYLQVFNINQFNNINNKESFLKNIYSSLLQ